MDKAQIERGRIGGEILELSSKFPSVLLELATGVGKSKIALDCSSEEQRVLILVAETLHINNWKLEIEKWGYSSEEFTIVCYASIHLYENSEFDAVIFDECHHLSIERTKIASTIKARKHLFLSATVDAEVRGRIFEIQPNTQIYTVSLQEAIELDILPSPTIYLIPIKPNNVIKKHRTKFGKRTYLLTDKGKSDWFDNQIDYWSGKYKEAELKNEQCDIGEEKDNEWMKTKYIRLGGERKKFLSTLKTLKAKELLNTLQNTRSIWFCGSKEQADELGGSMAVHSGRGKKENQHNVTLFNEGTNSKLFVQKMMREAVNLNSIEAGIVIQLDSGADEGLSSVQILGRVLRSHTPIIYIFYCPNTQDEKYLKTALKYLPTNNIKQYEEKSPSF